MGFRKGILALLILSASSCSLSKQEREDGDAAKLDPMVGNASPDDVVQTFGLPLQKEMVGENRKFTKALIRNSTALAGLRGSLTGLDLPNTGIETLQIVFMDKNLDDVRVIGSLDRITQIEVGIPEDLDQYPDGDGFVDLIRSAVLRAIPELLVPSTARVQMLARVRGSV